MHAHTHARAHPHKGHLVEKSTPARTRARTHAHTHARTHARKPTRALAHTERPPKLRGGGEGGPEGRGRGGEGLGAHAGWWGGAGVRGGAATVNIQLPLVVGAQVCEVGRWQAKCERLSMIVGVLHGLTPALHRFLFQVPKRRSCKRTTCIIT